MLLIDGGFEVMPARSGPEALQCVQRHTPSLAIIDYKMPGMDGLTLCHRLRDRPAIQALPMFQSLNGAPLRSAPGLRSRAAT